MRSTAAIEGLVLRQESISWVIESVVTENTVEPAFPDGREGETASVAAVLLVSIPGDGDWIRGYSF